MTENAKILVVEDEQITALEIETNLKQLGYNVPPSVIYGEEAVQKAEELKPDLVLMDIHLKGEMDGVAAAEQIQRRFGIPVIYLTANTDELTLQRAKLTGPYGFILKPFETRELRTNIEMALYKNNMENALRESEAKLVSVFNTISDGICISDLNGKILDVNDTYLDIYKINNLKD